MWPAYLNEEQRNFLGYKFESLVFLSKVINRGGETGEVINNLTQREV